MPEVHPQDAGVFLCEAAVLVERGKACVFEVSLWGQRTKAFVVRYNGMPVAYINRCAHVPAELDWMEGEFFDQARERLICSIHGAVYDPASGRCVGGPCQKGRLMGVTVRERGGQVYWYPSNTVQPVR